MVIALHNIHLLFALLFILTLSPEVTAKPGHITACSSKLWLPFNWESQGKLEGAGVDIARQFFAQQNVSFEAVALGSWARCLKLVEEGNIDLALNVYKTADRALFGDYVDEPIAFDTIRIFVHPDSSFSITRLDHLRRLRGGGVIGDSYGDSFDEFKKTLAPPYWSEVPQHEQNVKKLALKRLDYAVMNPWNLKLIMAKLQRQGGTFTHIHLKTIGEPVSRNGLYFLFSKKTAYIEQYGALMNAYIAQLKTSGRMQRIIDQAFQDYQTQLALKPAKGLH